MGWRLADSLIVLRDQINAAYPNRSKASDGTIGDSAHAATPSDHNPNSQGVVCAFDITDDPANGLDAHALANLLISDRNPNLKYVISNSRIAGEWSDWKWENYTGSNPHSKHIHVSVGRGPDGMSVAPYDGLEKWNIKGETIMTPTIIDNLFQAVFNRQSNKQEVDYWMQRSIDEFSAWLIKNSIDQRTAASEFKNVSDALKRSDKEVDKLRKQLADNPTDLELIDGPVYKKVK